MKLASTLLAALTVLSSIPAATAVDDFIITYHVERAASGSRSLTVQKEFKHQGYFAFNPAPSLKEQFEAIAA